MRYPTTLRKGGARTARWTWRGGRRSETSREAKMAVDLDKEIDIETVDETALSMLAPLAKLPSRRLSRGPFPRPLSPARLGSLGRLPPSHRAVVAPPVRRAVRSPTHHVGGDWCQGVSGRMVVCPLPTHSVRPCAAKSIVNWVPAPTPAVRR